MISGIIKKSFLYYFLGFIIFTVLGTITHEFGHIVVAKSLGYGTTLHYGSMNWNERNGWEEFKTITRNFQYEIENDLSFDKKGEYENIVEKLNSDRFKIVMGGVLQTILFGSVGFLILLLSLKSIKKNGFRKIDWLIVFLALFWLREVFNVVVSVFSAFLNNNDTYFTGDESVLSERLNFPSGAVSITLGLIGAIISFIIVFKIIPIKERLTFIVAGLIGSTFGYFLWMKIVGPSVLP
jgi:hypothetical protein